MTDLPNERVSVIHGADPDLLLAINEIKDAIKDMKPDPPMSLGEMEALGFPGEKPTSWITIVLAFICLISMIFCSAHMINNFFLSHNLQQEDTMAKTKEPQIKLTISDADEKTIKLTDKLLEYYSGTRKITTVSEPETDEDGNLDMDIEGYVTSDSIDLTLNLTEETMQYILEKILSPLYK
jgi:hypothetical protein